MAKKLLPAVEPFGGIPRRRELLGFFAGVAAAVPAALTLGRAADGAKRSGPTERRAPTKLLSPRGRRLGVVVVVPVAPRGVDSFDERGYRLGRALGEFLDHGSDADLAPLAAMSLECMGHDEVEAPSTPKDAFWLLVGDAAVHFRLADGHDDAAIDGRIAAVAEAFGRALATVAPATRDLPLRLQEVARRCERGESISTFLDGNRGAEFFEPRADQSAAPPITPAEADRYAAQFLGLAARAAGKARHDLHAMLAARVRARLSKVAVPGSEWMSSGGCANSYEERPGDWSGGVGCGMGHVPERSRRFLSFFTQV